LKGKPRGVFEVGVWKNHHRKIERHRGSDLDPISENQVLRGCKSGVLRADRKSLHTFCSPIAKAYTFSAPDRKSLHIFCGWAGIDEKNHISPGQLWARRAIDDRALLGGEGRREMMTRSNPQPTRTTPAWPAMAALWCASGARSLV